MAVLMQWLLVIPVLVVYSQGQSEGITGLVDNNTLAEWSQLSMNTNLPLADRQMLFLGIRFRCSGNLTKWVVGAGYRSDNGRDRYPALGIYRPRGDGDFDRVGVTVFEHPEFSPSRIYEFTPDPPLPFQTNDHLGIYLPPGSLLRVRPNFRDVTGGPNYRNYNPGNPDDPVEGVQLFDITGTTIQTNRVPLVAVEIESDDPDSASCTSDFISQDLLGLLAPNVVTPNNQQIVFPSYNFTSDGVITSWTLGARWANEVGRDSFPELQIWRRNADDNTYDRINSTGLTASAENPNQLYSDMIDPPLQFQSGDVLGMFLPNDVSNGARLLVNFARDAGPTYEFRPTNVPLSTIVFAGLETNNDRPFLALEISLVPSPTVMIQSSSSLILQPSSTTNVASPSPSSTVFPLPPSSPSPVTTNVASISTSISSTVIPPPTINGSPTTTIIIVVVICGLALAVATIAVILIIILLCTRKNDSNLTDPNVDAIDMAATDEPYYDNPFQQEKTAVSTKHNEAYATTITTDPNEAYATTVAVAPNAAYSSTAVPLQSNEAYDTTHHGDTTADDEYDYI